MAFVGCTRPPIYSTKYNLDFEYAKNDSVPTRWMLGNSSTTGYHISLDKQIKQHGTTSIRIQWEQPTRYNSLGGFRHIFPKTLVAGKELEVSGWIKTRDIEQDGFAGFHLFGWEIPGTSGYHTSCTENLRLDSYQHKNQNRERCRIHSSFRNPQRERHCVVRQYRTQNRREKIRRQSDSGSENGIIRQGEKRAAPIRLSAADLRTGRRGHAGPRHSPAVGRRMQGGRARREYARNERSVQNEGPDHPLSGRKLRIRYFRAGSQHARMLSVEQLYRRRY